MKPKNVDKVRYEYFGGIVEVDDPPMLAFVDKTYMKELGYKNSLLWDGEDKYLSAPTEVHFSITNKCPLDCSYCASDSGEALSQELTTAELKEAIDVLAEMNVFHVALGGGEIFERSDAIEIAEYCRTKGIVPNCTINGYYMNPDSARQCRIFGQINVSLDGIGENYNINRDTTNIFSKADRAIRMLVEAGNSVGINTVITRKNFDLLEEVVQYADKLNLKEVLFLRLKPAGRGKDVYDQYCTTHKQNKEFFPRLLKWAEKYSPNLQIDCSLVPHIFYHEPSKKIMNLFGIEGCTGANVLLGVRPDGYINACSHYPEYYQNIFHLPVMWNKDQHFTLFREREITDVSCTECSYFSICRGGCPLFSLFLKDDFNVPDPECLVLLEKKEQKVELL